MSEVSRESYIKEERRETTLNNRDLRFPKNKIYTCKYTL